MNNLELYFLEESLYQEYETFIKSTNCGTFFYSLKYKLMLEAILQNTISIYLIIKNQAKIVAIFPMMIKESSCGNVMNSLPFYSSHGGILFADNLEKEKKEKIIDLVVKEIEFIEKKYNIISKNIVANIFGEDVNKNFKHNILDERIGQIVDLSFLISEEALFNSYHYKTRNMIKKAQKNSIIIQKSFSYEDMMQIYKLHVENINALNGLVKPVEMFEYIHKNLSKSDYSLHVAKYNNEIIAGLLTFKFNHTVEYFVPCIKTEYRNLQPLSLLIHQELLSLLNTNYKYYNFGGTWVSQDGVYRFKKRWGSKDIIYKYYIDADVKKFSEIGKEKILQEYKYFYTAPFEKLTCQKN